MFDQIYETKEDAFNAGKIAGRAEAHNNPYARPPLGGDIMTRGRINNAIGKYCDAHPEAGECPLFHHREQMAHAIMIALGLA